MRTLCLAMALAASATWFAASARADDGIPADTLAAIKAATVFVKVEASGLTGSGSGFVIKTEGDSAYIVTNHHVIEPKFVELVLVPRYRPMPRRPYNSRLPRGPSPGPYTMSPSYTPEIMVRSFKNVTATVVFGSGTEKEQSLRGEILAADPEQDLAVLKVSGVKNLPRPIDYQREPALNETMPVYTFGFPFGKELATSKNGPAITVGNAAISSLRRDDSGELALVQIDGSLNPGNSGGPVVDSQGRLVGIAVAIIRGSNGIGLAIPGRQLVDTLEGRVGKVYVHSTRGEDGAVKCQVEIALIDPLDKLKSVELHYLTAGPNADQTKTNDPLSGRPGCQKLSLKLDKHVATGEFTLKPDGGDTRVALVHQAAYVNEAGKHGLTKIATETIRVLPAAVANASVPNDSYGATHNGLRATATSILGGTLHREFRDTVPGWLVGFDVGLRKWTGGDVVCAVRPIFANDKGEEVLGSQHGGDTSHVVRIKAKPGYAVGAINVNARAVVDGFSATFMKIGDGRLDPNEHYESDWVGVKGTGAPASLGGDGNTIVGIVGREDGRDLEGLGLLEFRSNRHWSHAAAAHDGLPHSEPEPAAAPADRTLPGGEGTIVGLPAPADDVVAGGSGRYLLLRLPTLQKLALFDVTQSKITHYFPLPGDALIAAGGEKLIVMDRDQGLVQRFDLATLQKELTVTLPDLGQIDGLVMGSASAGPAMIMTREGPRFLDVQKLSLIELKGAVDGRWRPHPQYPLSVRASADGSTFAAWEPRLSPAGIRVLTLEGGVAHCRYQHSSAGVLVPSYDGGILFTEAGAYGSDLQPLTHGQYPRAICFPADHPAFFLTCAYDESWRTGVRTGKPPKLSVYTTADRRFVISLMDLDELHDPREAPFAPRNPLTIDQRVHFFPAANLLVTVPAARDQLVLRKLDVLAALEKAGVDYLYVASLPPAKAERGTTLNYMVAVKSRRGGVKYSLDSGPDGMTLSPDGKLEWKVPADAPTDRQAVIISIKDASGQEILHLFNLTVQ